MELADVERTLDNANFITRQICDVIHRRKGALLSVSSQKALRTTSATDMQKSRAATATSQLNNFTRNRENISPNNEGSSKKPFLKRGDNMRSTKKPFLQRGKNAVVQKTKSGGSSAWAKATLRDCMHAPPALRLSDR